MCKFLNKYVFLLCSCSPVKVPSLCYLVDVDSDAGGRDEQQSLHALGPRHQPTWALTQSRTRLTTICTGEICYRATAEDNTLTLDF